MKYDAERALAALTDARRVSAAGARPRVVAQLGQSLDGRIATPTGQSKYISGPGALAHLHRLRAAVDAVLVGVNTVIVDDPLLTVRLAAGPSPIRVIIDPSGRLPASSRCLDPETPGAVWVIRGEESADDEKAKASLPEHVDIIRVPRTSAGSLDPGAVLDAIGARGVQRVLLEGGADTLSRALDAGVVDWLHVTVSPVILGSGKPGLSLAPIDALSEGHHPKTEVHVFDDGDALFCCDLRARRVVSTKPVGIGLAAAE